ncbi:MAG: heat shock protein HspQ [Legionellales bacterium]|nr:heat shock protein HspQ [Legionellales bacterium]
MSATSKPIKTAKFNVGDQVIHQNQGYRGVIIDIDPMFQASGRYNPQSCKYEFTTRHPWYRILVDNSSQQTYVEEPLLLKDTDPKEISNPQITQYLVQQNGRYASGHAKH